MPVFNIVIAHAAFLFFRGFSVIDRRLFVVKGLLYAFTDKFSATNFAGLILLKTDGFSFHSNKLISVIFQNNVQSLVSVSAPEIRAVLLNAQNL